MRVTVVGAGVVGVASAYYLWRAGHAVSLVERRSAPALEASLENAGGLCPGFSGPWASPVLLAKAPGWLLRRNAPLAFGRGLCLADLAWLAHFAANCRADAFRRNKERIQRLAHYSRASLLALNAELGWGDNYDFRPTGVLQLFRDPRDLANARRRAVPVLARQGVAHRLLEAADLAAAEPALAGDDGRFVGGLLLPGDAAGDSHRFATQLADWLRARGVSQRFDCPVAAIETQGGAVRGLRTADGELLPADACVLAVGAQAATLARPLGIKLPIRPVKGYTLTARIRDAARAPALAVMDEAHKTMITRLGNRLRIAGMAVIAGFDATAPARVRAFLQQRLDDVYPNAVDFADAHFGAGLRPMTWDGPPILGRTPVAGLYLNAGHGSGGWTQACGSGRVIADLIDGATPGIALDGLTLERFADTGATP